MKKINLTLLTLCIGVQVLTSCSSDKQEENNADTATVAASSTSPSTAEKVEKTENGPASYEVTAMPDSAILGKDREALVKIMDVNVLELTDADGNSTGSELTVKLSVTNKSKLDAKKYFTLDPSEARLELDNKISVPYSDSSGNTSPQAESTSESTWTFTLPANTKPAKLNFFMSGTRVGVNLSPQA
jgi:hypothetical protein